MVEVQVGVDVKRRVSGRDSAVGATSVVSSAPKYGPCAAFTAGIAATMRPPSLSSPVPLHADEQPARTTARPSLSELTAAEEESTPAAVAGSKNGLSPTRRLIHGALGLPRSRKERAPVVEVVAVSPSTPVAEKTRMEAVPLLTPDDSPETSRRSSGGRGGGRRSDPKAVPIVREVPAVEVCRLSVRKFQLGAGESR